MAKARKPPKVESSSTLIDITAMRLGSVAPNGRRVEKCPECGRNGTISRHNDGSELIIHTGENIGVGLSVRDRCFVPSKRGFAKTQAK